jgi:hypothetical protein
MVIEQGVTDNSDSALATAKQWIDDFDASLDEEFIID